MHFLCAVYITAGTLKLFVHLPPCFVLRRNMLPCGARPSKARGTTCWNASHCGTGVHITQASAARTSYCAMSHSSEALATSAAVERLPVAGCGLPEMRDIPSPVCLPLLPHLATMLTHHSQSAAHPATTRPQTRGHMRRAPNLAPRTAFWCRCQMARRRNGRGVPYWSTHQVRSGVRSLLGSTQHV